ncbi:PEPxxWA-CTERM sorting domain-containing protein [Qipengyuania sp.]|uniref:PEPxxWA-CTERM sorting domain-containing protein n=1 Tax=Qipengyuania sp. TaxID=2004515 RepID=UPI0035C7D7F3
MKALYLACAAAVGMAAPAAHAATIVFTTTSPTTSTQSQQAVSSGGETAIFTGGTYTSSVAAMNAASANVTLTARSVERSSTGLGVAGDGEANQVDSNGANELLQLVFASPTRYRIVSAVLGRVDNNDTFALFGGNGGVYTRLGFSGPIANGMTGGVPVTTTSLGGGNYRLDFNFGGGYDSFRFGTNDEEADGFSLRSLSVAAVPEPSTWAMLILGFGLVGGAMRRKAAPAIKAAVA